MNLFLEAWSNDYAGIILTSFLVLNYPLLFRKGYIVVVWVKSTHILCFFSPMCVCVLIQVKIVKIRIISENALLVFCSKVLHWFAIKIKWVRVYLMKTFANLQHGFTQGNQK